ncbi:MAG: nickel/cobalt transporter [Pyrinomonadaceae bacterium]
MLKQKSLLAAFFMLAFAAIVTAHPLGNFTVNQFSRLEVEKSQIKIFQVLDLAEIPTFQASSEIDTNKDGALSPEELNAYAEKITPDYTANLLLSVNGAPVALHPQVSSISLQPGAGNLPQLRIEWNLTGDLPDASSVNRVHFENKNNAGRIGWNEIVVNRTSDVNVFNSTAFGTGISDALKVFPQESLSAPLAERSADFSYTSGVLPPNAKTLLNRDGHRTTPVEKDKFAELINVPEITFPIALFGLLLAFGLGALHAMSPGHGKTVVGAYLVGSRGTIKHAMFLGATVTITHTLGVFALGLVTLFASEYILPERLMPYLNFISGFLVLIIGLTLFKERLFTFFNWNKKTEETLLEDDPLHTLEELENYPLQDNLTHTHGGSTHSHLPPKKVSWRNLLVLGISGGLLPCPSALVLMLSAISLDRIGYGLVLTLVFSFGLAATLITIGLIFLYVGRIFDNPTLGNNRLVKALPLFSAFVVTCLGAIICYSSLA